MIVEFIWSGKSTKIAYNNIIQNIELGGLKLTDIESKIESILIGWIKRICNDNTCNWTATLKSYLKSSDMTNLFKENRDVITTDSLFYQSILNSWKKVREQKEITKFTIQNEIIWNNRFIKINNKTLNWKKWKAKGIIKLSDILDRNGKFLTLVEIKNKYGISVNILDYISLTKNMPKDWIIKLSEKHSIPNDEELKLASIMELKFVTKDIYNVLVTRKYSLHKSIKKWESEFPLLKDEEAIWPKIYYNAFLSTRDTQIQSFQYKIIMKILNCNKKLYDWSIRDNPICDYCELIDDTSHFLLKCNNAKMFWKSLLNWWNRLGIQEIYLLGQDLVENLIFGFHIIDNSFKILNFICLHAKFYIYKQKRQHNNNNLFLYDFLCLMKQNIKDELFLCEKDGNVDLRNLYKIILDEL
jgi:hypothetical protein